LNIRERTEQLEDQILSPLGAKSCDAVRERLEPSCEIRTAYQRDRDRILHSKAFRRLKHKTQVYISPGDHYRTRMTHSLETAQISRTIARGLRLNEDLVEAVALGHDVGHTPFSHAGEEALKEILGHYAHNEQSLRVVAYLEKDGQGLNLTNAVKDGIANHTGPHKPYTMEGNIVRIGDRIAYLCHDYDDGMRAGLLSASQIPERVVKVLGVKPSDMIRTMVRDMITVSQEVGEVKLSPPVQQAMDEFRQFMFTKVYNSPTLDDERRKAKYVVHKLYEHYMAYPETIPQEFISKESRWGMKTTVVDYIAGLTDTYAIYLFEKLFVPSSGIIKR